MEELYVLLRANYELVHLLLNGTENLENVMLTFLFYIFPLDLIFIILPLILIYNLWKKCFHYVVK